MGVVNKYFTCDNRNTELNTGTCPAFPRRRWAGVGQILEEAYLAGPAWPDRLEPALLLSGPDGRSPERREVSPGETLSPIVPLIHVDTP